MLERGIEAEIPAEGPGRCPATRETIGMMIELVYLESKNYNVSLREWKETLAREELQVAGASCRLKGGEGVAATEQVEGSGKGRTTGRRGLKGARASKRKSTS
jgi:hypothetical protein